MQNAECQKGLKPCISGGDTILRDCLGRGIFLFYNLFAIDMSCKYTGYFEQMFIITQL